jgi:hypothetical protein
MAISSEHLESILSYLPAVELQNTALVSRKWEELSSSLLRKRLESRESEIAEERTYKLGYTQGIESGQDSSLQSGFEAGLREGLLFDTRAIERVGILYGVSMMLSHGRAGSIPQELLDRSDSLSRLVSYYRKQLHLSTHLIDASSVIELEMDEHQADEYEYWDKWVGIS